MDDGVLQQFHLRDIRLDNDGHLPEYFNETAMQKSEMDIPNKSSMPKIWFTFVFFDVKILFCWVSPKLSAIVYILLVLLVLYFSKLSVIPLTLFISGCLLVPQRTNRVFLTYFRLIKPRYQVVEQKLFRNERTYTFCSSNKKVLS